MKKIYIVIEVDDDIYEWNYSEEIVGVFENRKIAEILAESFKDMRIDEHEFSDNDIRRLGLDLKKRIFFVRMFKDGKIDYIEEEKGYYWFKLAAKKEETFVDNNKIFTVYILANDEKHAIKIINERRVQLIANNEWK